MAKRDVEIDSTEEFPVEPEVSPVGEQLRVAREEKGLSLEDVAAQTRIPLRHLASIETGDWENLPAATYTVGFAKSYASAVGLDRVEIGNQLREEMGGQRFASSSPEFFEAADPARTMPKWLVVGAIAAVILLVVVMSWLNRRSLDEPDAAANTAAAANETVVTPQAVPAGPVPVAQGGPVVLTAIAPVWLQVSERGGPVLFSGMLQPGQTYPVPPSATAPVLKTGKPEAIKITVGNAFAGPVGPTATTVTNVSLLGADLLKSPAAAAASAAPTPATASSPAPRPRARSATAPPPAAPPPAQPPVPEPSPPTGNTVQ
jgi:cytoskeletal protein RodZ